MSRIFLVGSGPSLAQTPMDLLIGEHCMAMNKIGRIVEYHGWKWRPTHYFKIDINTVDHSHKDEIMWAVDNECQMFLWEQLREGYSKNHINYEIIPEGLGELPRTTWIKKCKHTPYQHGNYKAAQSWHFPEICTAYGGMSSMIQIAVLLGYTEIYLLGCDLGYTPDVNQNHAIPNYTKDRRDKSDMDNGNMLALHKMAKRCSPIPIYNATIGGYLEVYPRVDLMEVLCRETDAKPQP